MPTEGGWSEKGKWHDSCFSSSWLPCTSLPLMPRWARAALYPHCAPWVKPCNLHTALRGSSHYGTSQLVAGGPTRWVQGGVGSGSLCLAQRSRVNPLGYGPQEVRVAGSEASQVCCCVVRCLNFGGAVQCRFSLGEGAGSNCCFVQVGTVRDWSLDFLGANKTQVLVELQELEDDMTDNVVCDCSDSRQLV